MFLLLSILERFIDSFIYDDGGAIEEEKKTRETTIYGSRMIMEIP